jgi:hypothetical protein
MRLPGGAIKRTAMPKLTLRDLFAVVTIVALALGWWLDRSRLARIHAVTREELRLLQYQVYVQKAMADAADGATPYLNPAIRDQTSGSK